MQSSLGTNDRAANRREMRRKVDKVERVTSALRDALMAYGNLDGPGCCARHRGIVLRHALQARCTAARKPRAA